MLLIQLSTDMQLMLTIILFFILIQQQMYNISIIHIRNTPAFIVTVYLFQLGIDTIFNIYDYDDSLPDVEVFDVASCFNSSARLDFRVRFAGICLRLLHSFLPGHLHSTFFVYLYTRHLCKSPFTKKLGFLFSSNTPLLQVLLKVYRCSSGKIFVGDEDEVFPISVVKSLLRDEKVNSFDL